MNDSLGKFLYDLRKKTNITIKDLMSKLGISHQYINDLENGKRTPSDSLLEKIADVYNLKHQERIKLFDLATESSKTKKIPVDIANYIKDNKKAKEAIRELIYEEVQKWISWN